MWLEFRDGKTLVSAASSVEMEEAGGAEEMGARAEISVTLREAGQSTLQRIANVTGMNTRTVWNVVSHMKRSGEVDEVAKEGHAEVYSLRE